MLKIQTTHLQYSTYHGKAEAEAPTNSVMSRRSHTQSDCYRVNFIHLQENHVAHCSTILFYYFPQKMFVMYIRIAASQRESTKKNVMLKKKMEKH